MVPSGPRTIDDYAALARTRLPAPVRDHLHEGDEGENAAAFARIRLVPRPLADVRGGHTRLELFGAPLAHPILLAPVAYQALFHADGEIASAMAADAQGGIATLSTLASRSIEDVLKVAPGTWFQLYWQGSRERTARLLDRALAAGCRCIVFTIDAPVKAASLTLPPHVRAVNVEPDEARPPIAPGRSAIFDDWMRSSPLWNDLAWLRERTPVPLVVKGILHADDAERACALGCDGIVVSDHGGRVLRGAVPAIDALPAIVERVGGRVPVLVDGGIRSGQDVFRAMALGASAVMIGRPYVWALAVDGAMGVAHVIRLLRDELEMTMALCGCATLADVARAMITSRPRA